MVEPGETDSAAEATGVTFNPTEGRSNPTGRRSTRPGRSFNPWSVVNLFFHHSWTEGCIRCSARPGTGWAGGELLRALGIEPASKATARWPRRARASRADPLGEARRR